MADRPPASPAADCDAEQATRRGDSAATLQREAAFCCAVDEDRALLEALPAEVIERDDGCGDPSRDAGPRGLVPLQPPRAAPPPRDQECRSSRKATGRRLVLLGARR